MHLSQLSAAVVVVAVAIAAIGLGTTADDAGADSERKSRLFVSKDGHLVFNPGATLAVEIPAKLLIANATSADGAAATAATIDVAKQMNMMFEQLGEMKGNLDAANGKIATLSEDNEKTQNDLAAANKKIDALTIDNAGLEDQLDGVKANLTALQDSFNTSKGDLAAANGRIDGLRDENADLKTNNVAIKEDHAALKTRVDGLEAAATANSGTSRSMFNTLSIFVYGGGEADKNDLARAQLADVRFLDHDQTISVFIVGEVDAMVFNEIFADLETVGSLNLNNQQGKTTGTLKGAVTFKKLQLMYTFTVDIKVTSLSFPVLRQIGGGTGLKIANTPDLKSVSFPALVHATKLALLSCANLDEVLLPALQTAGTLSVTNNPRLTGSGIRVNPDILRVVSFDFTAGINCSTTNGLTQAIAGCKRYDPASQCGISANDPKFDSSCNHINREDNNKLSAANTTLATAMSNVVYRDELTALTVDSTNVVWEGRDFELEVYGGAEAFKNELTRTWLKT